MQQVSTDKKNKKHKKSIVNVKTECESEVQKKNENNFPRMVVIFYKIASVQRSVFLSALEPQVTTCRIFSFEKLDL